MIPLTAIQAAAKTLIAASVYFSGQTIIADVGNAHNEREQALKSPGQYVSVTLPAMFRVTDQGAGRIVGVGVLPIYAAVNPQVPDAKPILEMCIEIKNALVGEVLKNEHERWRLDEAESAIIQTFNDPGKLEYLMMFTKLCTM